MADAMSLEQADSRVRASQAHHQFQRPAQFVLPRAPRAPCPRISFHSTVTLFQGSQLP